MQQDTNGFKLIQEILKLLNQNKDRTLKEETEVIQKDGSCSSSNNNADPKLSLHVSSEGTCSSLQGNYSKYNQKHIHYY